MKSTIKEFRGEFRWMSNFWPAEVTYRGVKWPTVEHAYQAAKVTSLAELNLFIQCKTPGDAKRLSRNRSLIKVRPDWDMVKLEIMRGLQEQKYQNPELMAKLMATGSRKIEEGNTWGDTFWGVCNGKGENWMGLILMAIRERNRNDKSTS